MIKFKLPMLYAKLSQRIILILLVFVFFVGSFSNPSWTAETDLTLASVEKRLKKVESNQAAILAEQEEVVDLIKQLKIWARRKNRKKGP